MLKLEAPIVSADWLFENLEHPDLILLDTTIKKATDKSEFERNEYIKNAQFFDIKNEFSNFNAPFPNTLLSPKIFEIKAQALGINNDNCIVVYDCYGYYSCARVWFMFRAMGFENIAVLDGGFPSWKEADYPIQNEPSINTVTGNFTVKNYTELIHNHEKVKAAIQDKKTTIVDARSKNRFLGLVEEPRHGLRSGHIPNSRSLPFSTILDGAKMKPKKELKKIFSEFENDNLIFSCGSGITACVLALGAEVAGIENKTVYDGSWTEWGSLSELPIEK